jgi:outer membrane protein TolC
MRNHLSLLIILPAALLAVAGCSTFDPARTRAEQSRLFRATLERQASELLAKPLSLNDCIRIAMTNNYAARKADLDTEIMRIAKNTAFTAFLPNVSLSAGYNSHHKAPKPHEREALRTGQPRGGRADLHAFGLVPLCGGAPWP